MGQTPRELEEHIASERQRLDRNIDELEGRFREAADWRLQTRKHPLAVAGAAMAGGFLLAGFIGSGRNGRRSSFDGAASATRQRNTEHWELLKGTLIGVGSRWFTDFLARAVPHFGEEYDRQEKRRHTASG